MKKLIKWYFSAIAGKIMFVSLLWFMATFTVFILIAFNFSGEYWLFTDFGYLIFKAFGVFPYRGSLLIGLIIFILHSALAYHIRLKYITWVSNNESQWDKTVGIWFRVLVLENKLIEFKRSLWGKRDFIIISRPRSSMETKYNTWFRYEPEDFHVNTDFEFNHKHWLIKLLILIKIKLNGRPSMNELYRALTYKALTGVELRSDLNIEQLIKKSFEAKHHTRKTKQLVVRCVTGEFPTNKVLEEIKKELNLPFCFSNFEKVDFEIKMPEISIHENMEDE